MGTKALKSVLEYMEQQHGRGMMEDAEKELEAIKRAASFWVSRAGDLNAQEHEAHDDLMTDIANGTGVMDSIAKDAP